MLYFFVDVPWLENKGLYDVFNLTVFCQFFMVLFGLINETLVYCVSNLAVSPGSSRRRQATQEERA